MYRTIVLAYSGGLDTSIIVPWLKENYGGRASSASPPTSARVEVSLWRARQAIASGADEAPRRRPPRGVRRVFHISDATPGAIYNRKYLLGTSMARPLIAADRSRSRVRWR
jgi:argininosuccinate synthase